MKFLKNDHGVSMVEIMVAASMLGMLALAGSKLMQNQTQAMKTIETKSEYNAVLNDIRTILSDSASCMQNFGGANAKTAGPYTNIIARVSGSNIIRFTANANWQLAPAYGNGKVRITNMVLTDAAGDVETTAGLVQGTTNLAVTFMLGLHPQSKLPQYTTKFVKLNISTNGATTAITDCSSVAADNSLNDLTKACAAIGGTWLPATERCDLVDFTGPPDTSPTEFESVSTAYLNNFFANLENRYVNISGDTMTGHLQVPTFSQGGALIGGWQFGVSGPAYFLQNVQVNGAMRILGSSQIDGNAVVLGQEQVNSYFSNGGGVIHGSYITSVHGNMWVTGAIQQSSDRRLKKDIQDIKNALANVKKLRPRSYIWKKTNAPHMGLIAQEIALVFPDLVQEANDGKLGVDYGQLIPVLIGAIKDLDQENTKLKSELDLIKSELCLENKTYKFCKR